MLNVPSDSRRVCEVVAKRRRGEDLARMAFNSRSREGGDEEDMGVVQAEEEAFIHLLVAGA